jgi:SRF-type transcription factor (DNA-binding and dimerisation domain)
MPYFPAQIPNQGFKSIISQFSTLLKMPRRVTQEAQERRNRTRQLRKRKLGVFKKVHNLKTDCGYESALVVIHPKTGKLHTYRTSNHPQWAAWFDNMVSHFKYTLFVCLHEIGAIWSSNREYGLREIPEFIDGKSYGT